MYAMVYVNINAVLDCFVLKYFDLLFLELSFYGLVDVSWWTEEVR